MSELSRPWATFLIAFGILLAAELVRSALVAIVTVVAGVAAALDGPIRKGLHHLCARIPGADPRNWVAAIFQLALIVVCALTAAANFAVVRDTIRVVWPTGISPSPLALGIVLLTGSLGYLLHRAGSWTVRAAILIVVAALALVQANLAFERARQVVEIDDLMRAASAGAGPSGSLVLGGDATRNIETGLQGVLPSSINALFGIPLLSALIAGFLCLAEGLTTWGVATYSKEEIIWYFVSPLLLLLVAALVVTDFISGARTPVKEAIESVMNAIISLRAFISRSLRSLIPRTQLWCARRDLQLQREHETRRLTDEKEAEAAARRHKLDKEEAQRRSEREDLAHEEAKRRLSHQADLARHAADLDLPAPSPSFPAWPPSRRGWTGR